MRWVTPASLAPFLPGLFCRSDLATVHSYCVPLFDGAGVIGFGDDEPEPSVLGGVAVRLAVVRCEESLLAMLLFQLATVTKPISSSAATAAAQAHAPAMS